ncbi:MAG: tetratricopeptide repeat protein [Archangiaceae bacterium]|nr:tetratricopeptide repeat protein [Archangiaceae bacterium]
MNLAIVTLERERYAEAERLLRPEAERPDGLATALEVLAHAVGAQGREAEAVELLRRSQQGRAQP